MFQSVLKKLMTFSGGANKLFVRRTIGVSAASQSHHVETDEEFIRRYKDYFGKDDIDHWEIRKGMNDLAQTDGVPDPEIIVSALRAARRLNDYALTVRLLETVQMKCGPKKKTIWPYILGEIQPTLQELGIDTPEELGYDKPELWCESTDIFYEGFEGKTPTKPAYKK